MKYNINDLKQKKIFALDMDGTIYLGQKIFPFTLPFLEGLLNQDKDFIFLTNNSSRTPEQYREKLSRMGITIDLSKIYTSGDATIEYLKRIGGGNHLYVLGTPELCHQFENAGFTTKSNRPDFVVLGFDLTFDYKKLDQACRFIRQGVSYVATHPDFNCPLENGDMLPDCGALSAAITAATGVQPKVIGKPNQEMLAGLLTRLGIDKNELAVVGDRLMTDIQMGNDFDIFTILVLSGETKRSQLAAATQRPDLVVERNIDILSFLR